MVKKILFLSWLFFTIWSWIIFANNQNKTSIDVEFEEKPEILEKSFKLESEKLSCTNLNKKLIKFFEENKEFLKPIYRPRWFLEKWLLLKSEDLATNSIAWSNDNISQSLNIERNSTESNFSKTNIQKENVDEPEILKINENVFAYLHSWRSLDYKQHQKIEIISWNQNIKEIHSEINIQENFYVSNLLLYKNKLLVLWTRTIEKNTSSWYYTESFSRTTIMIIDIKNTKKPKIETVYDLSWQYQDSRLIWNKLYTFSDINIYLDYEKIYWDKKIDFNIQDYLSNWVQLNISNWKIKVWKEKLNCKDIQLFLPDKNTIKESWLNLWLSTIWIINLENNSIKQKAFLWHWIERHVTTNSIYLIQNENKETFEKWCWWFFWKCWYSYEWYSLIHKLNIDNNTWDINYQSSNIIKWSSTNWQYAIDENEEWKLRIVTSQNEWTNIYVLDKNLDVLWKLIWIQKDEHFKSSRFFWNKLYLVTFKRTDPFFVIDLSNDKPKILWELKIPWYSTYLHEYEKERNWKHLILWLWYDAEEKWNFSINKWIKLDLYEIDYSKKELWIKQLWSKVFWDKWSFSPTLENPRTFVYDKENKTVILPMILSNRFTEKECYDNNSKCYNIEKDSTKFFWSKILKVEKDWNIKEIWEIDWFQYFKDWLKEKVNKYYYDIDNNIFRYLQSLIYEGRSWYLWNKYFFISPLWYTDWKQYINF